MQFQNQLLALYRVKGENAFLEYLKGFLEKRIFLSKDMVLKGSNGNIFKNHFLESFYNSAFKNTYHTSNPFFYFEFPLRLAVMGLYKSSWIKSKLREYIIVHFFSHMCHPINKYFFIEGDKVEIYHPATSPGTFGWCLQGKMRSIFPIEKKGFTIKIF